MKNIAIITARSGSKGLKNKNIKLLQGKPLLAYAIEAALASKAFTEVMVSTDSEEYAQIARKYGAAVPFLRDVVTSGDKASSMDTVREVLKNYQDLGYTFDSFCLLQPTSPLRSSEDIRGAYELFNAKQAKAVVSVCEMEHSPLWSNVLPVDNSLQGFLDKAIGYQRQQMPQYYRLNGAVYIARIRDFLVDDNLYTENCYAYVMDKRNSVDIDTIDDFEYAEWLMRKK